MGQPYHKNNSSSSSSSSNQSTLCIFHTQEDSKMFNITSSINLKSKLSRTWKKKVLLMLFLLVLQYHQGIYGQRATTTQPHYGIFFQLQQWKDFLGSKLPSEYRELIHVFLQHSNLWKTSYVLFLKNNQIASFLFIHGF